MLTIYLSAIGYALLFALVYHSFCKPALAKPQQPTKKLYPVLIILLCAFIVRIILAANNIYHKTDITCFKAWADMAFKDGLNNFYTSDAFTDYPPGYIYVLYLIGALRYAFNLAYDSTLYTVIIKLPAIICDLITGFVLYKLLVKRTNSKIACSLSFLYLFNPAIIINSAVWGQVDSIYTLFVVAFIYFISEKKLLHACIFYTIGFLIKPQTVIFTPILLVYLYQILFMGPILSESRKESIKQIAISIVICVILLFVSFIPFTQNFDFMPIIKQYIATLSSYPYASVNAYNFFALFGGIWRDVNQTFLLLPYSVWSNIVIVLIVFVCVYFFIRRGGNVNLFMLGAFIITMMFTFAAKMHERYVFAAIILLFIAFSQKKDVRILFAAAFLSIGQFLNTAMVLYQDIMFSTTAPPAGAYVPIISLINIAAFILLSYVMVTQRESIIKTPEKKVKKKIQKEVAPFEIMRSEKKMPITRIDAIIMAAVTLIYSVVAFTNLGDMKAPETLWTSEHVGEGIYVEFENTPNISSVKWFTGPYEEKDILLLITTDDDSVIEAKQTLDSVFCWHEFSVGMNVKNVQVISLTPKAAIFELAFVDENNAVVAPSNISPIQIDRGINLLFDEQDTVPAVFSYKNGTYFDEIYHARTAYEHIHGLKAYENTHPPLGKILIALGVLIFGMNPFGWRFVGTLFGALMLPLIYLFAKKLFKKTSVAFVAIMLMATDFMHFAQTRIATIDVYIVFFIILMYYFMYDYTTKSFYDTPFKKTLIPLALCGICMGLGISTKWTGVYAAIGLALMFFISFGRRIYEYKKIMSDPRATKEQKRIVAPCKKYCTHTILWCILFFVIIPIIIYLLSYIPYLRAPGMNGISSVIDNQFTMFSYHSQLKETHPFSSSWFQWPVIARPIWYYSGNITETTRETIVSLGNPFVWWIGIGALAYCIYKMLKDKSYNALFLIVAWLAQYLPWVGVSRVVFIYHYFTCVPFVVLMICYLINDVFTQYQAPELVLSKKRAYIAVAFYIAVCIIAFISFYPALSGMQAQTTYIDSLRWYKSWIF